MSDRLLEYVLCRLEQFPKTLFWGTDLRARSPDEFSALQSSGLLRIVRPNPPEQICPCPSGAACEAEGREVVETNGKLWAICTCPAEEPPFVITRDHLHRYEVDLDSFVRLLRDTNSVAGHSSVLDDRLMLVGESTANGETVAWAFALLSDTRQSVTSLDSLRARLPRSIRSILVLTPSYRPPPEDAVRLESQGVYVVAGVTTSYFHVTAECVFGPDATMGSGNPTNWPDNYFQDEDGTWLIARILTERFGIPDSRLKDWREASCPDLDGEKLAAKKVAGIGWVYFQMHVNQIANRRDDWPAPQNLIQVL